MLRITPASLQNAAHEFLSASLSGSGWVRALDALAQGAGARSATLARTVAGHTGAVIWGTAAAAMSAPYFSGKRPPDVRAQRVRTFMSEGFRTDFDDFSANELTKEPYYQEFLRPAGYFWHAAARLDDGLGAEIDVSLKRSERAGPFDAAEIRRIGAILPDLRAAARVSRSRLDAGIGGMTTMLRRRGHFVYEFDCIGQVLRSTADSNAGPAGPFKIHRRRLTAADPKTQAAVDSLLFGITNGNKLSGVVEIASEWPLRRFLQLLAVTGDARDVFGGVVAVGVVIEKGGHQPPPPEQIDHRCGAFGLSGRESQIAVLIAEGMTPHAAAARLGIGLGTVRSHLKVIFQKTGTARQAEFVALLAALKP